MTREVARAQRRSISATGRQCERIVLFAKDLHEDALAAVAIEFVVEDVLPGTEVELDPAPETSSGLLSICYAFCPNILTAEQALIDQTIGYLSDATMRQIEDCLKASWDCRNQK